ncbi:LOW QUALITY PROTEIN: E3 ubiquitin-protein ligase Bre1 [Rhopalosiphum padi]|uniref:LOW QUALITY PROTEIN: E3 ubiquitin-protein ligase Bre1 n=1 Tax=Rhopalosiphum padi TaxID=40932 RepID=UPI00298E4EDD|nr:LOW QUALITY PROTEIN: E3 ubiquitin-protein ligase Bre1 [Rhopalosiphum padi]
MSKRNNDEGGSEEPPMKKVQFEPVRLGPISTMEDLDMKVLQYQNKKLAQRLEQRNRLEAELRNRIEQLEKRQTQDDSVLNVVNRYWNQLNEDIRVLLQRFDAETADELESKNESEATTSFLVQLSTWDKEELDEKLANRVQVSKRAVAKVIQAFDRLMQRNEKITLALKGEFEGDEAPSMDETVRQANSELQAENQKLQTLNTSLHKKYHTMSLKLAGLQDNVNCKETEVAEMRNQIEELQYEYQKILERNYKLETHLAEARDKLKGLEAMQIDDRVISKPDTSITQSSVSLQKVEELQKENEELRELNNNRLQELDKLHQQHREALMEVEKFKMDLRQLPESVIIETTEYKCLQSHFSVLYGEFMLMRNQLLESTGLLQNSKNTHLRQMEVMESDELSAQKKLRSELMNSEDVNAQLRKEYEMLRIEFEQNLAANEQTGPINREMRHLLSSLQNHNNQLKGELHRYKRKYKDANAEVPKLKKELEEIKLKLGQQITTPVLDSKEGLLESCKEDECGVNENIKEEFSLSQVLLKKEEDLEGISQLMDENVQVDEKIDVKNVKKEQIKDGQQTPNKTTTGPTTTPDQKTVNQKDVIRNWESEALRDLKTQLKKSVNDQKEMKLLLDMYKGVSKDQRDKVQLMAAEKKLRAELEEAKQALKKIQEGKREERKKLADEDALRKIKQLEEHIVQLQKQVATHKQEEEAMLSEMEVTGQAFEDMQEQNSRLIQQLREKDDANFKLMTERIKSNQLHKLAREETDTLKELIKTLTNQVEMTNTVVRKLEEKERILQNSLATVEKECTIRQQAIEMHKRKAIESAQSAADLKLHLDKYHAQMKEAQQVVTEKTSALEAEAYKTKRLQEEIVQLRRKTERMKKIEQAGTLDEVMMEEIREYKETLTCPSCKVKRKDAVLTKCFSCFCWDCLRTRYEGQDKRKCPKCNATFGANDYHRLYLGS